jgi:hypothetical protein
MASATSMLRFLKLFKKKKKSCPNCRLEKVKINVILKDLDMTIIKRISVVMNVNSGGLVD